MSVARVLLRVLLGALFVGHGAQKLLGWFGGSGLAGAAEEMEEFGLHPGRANAVAAGASQLAGGALLAGGLLTPLASTAIAGSMLTAMRTACVGRGPWSVNGGWEYPLVLTAAVLTFAHDGPGPLSLDRALGTEHAGPGTALAALALATGSSAAVVALGRDHSRTP